MMQEVEVLKLNEKLLVDENGLNSSIDDGNNWDDDSIMNRDYNQ
jgi:hypothetical protein